METGSSPLEQRKGSELEGKGKQSMKKSEFIRADQINLKDIDKHLSRVFTRDSGLNRKKEEWEINPSKLEIKDQIARGTFGTVYKGVYEGQDVAGIDTNYLMKLFG